MLTCDAGFGIEKLEELLRDQAVPDLSSLLWQRWHRSQAVLAGVKRPRDVQNAATRRLPFSSIACKKKPTPPSETRPSSAVPARYSPRRDGRRQALQALQHGRGCGRRGTEGTSGRSSDTLPSPPPLSSRPLFPRKEPCPLTGAEDEAGQHGGRASVRPGDRRPPPQHRDGGWADLARLSRESRGGASRGRLSREASARARRGSTWGAAGPGPAAPPLPPWRSRRPSSRRPPRLRRPQQAGRRTRPRRRAAPNGTSRPTRPPAWSGTWSARITAQVAARGSGAAGSGAGGAAPPRALRALNGLSRRRSAAAGRLGAERPLLGRLHLGVRRPPARPQRGLLHRRRPNRGGRGRPALGGGQRHPGGLRLR